MSSLLFTTVSECNNVYIADVRICKCDGRQRNRLEKMIGVMTDAQNLRSGKDRRRCVNRPIQLHYLRSHLTDCLALAKSIISYPKDRNYSILKTLWQRTHMTARGKGMSPKHLGSYLAQILRVHCSLCSRPREDAYQRDCTWTTCWQHWWTLRRPKLVTDNQKRRLGWSIELINPVLSN